MDLSSVNALRNVAVGGRAGGQSASFAVAVNQVLEGQVVQVGDGRALIRFGAQQVAVETQATLVAGEPVRLRVSDVTPERVVLQLVARGDQTIVRRDLSPADLANLLESWGLAATRENLGIARRLVERNLPLSREGLEELRLALARLGATSDADLDAAALLRARGLPISAGTLALARAHLGRSRQLGQQVQDLRDDLADLAETGELDAGDAAAPSAPTSAGRARIAALARQLQTSLPVVPADAASAELVARIQRVVEELGTSVEARLRQLAAEGGSGEALESDPRVLLARLAEAIEAELAAHPDPAERAGPLVRLRDELRALGVALEAQQLLNAADPPERSAERYYLFQIPLATPPDGEVRTARLRVYHRPGEPVDPTRVRLVLQLELQHLGPVEVDLRVVDRHVDCRVASATAEVAAFLAGEAESLRAGLGQLGYQVGEVRCVAERPGASDPARWEAPRRVVRIDARA